MRSKTSHAAKSGDGALKMDGASACYPYLAAPLELIAERVGWRGGCDEALGVIPGRTTSSADLGFSGLELGIAFIQAQVFVVLTSSYIKDGLDLH